MFKANKKMVEVWDCTEGAKSAILREMLKEEFDIRYERFSVAYTYYRIKATRKDVRNIAKCLKKAGYYAVLVDNRYFQVYR